MNENKISVYDSTGSTPVYDPLNLLDRAEQIRFRTAYPGGISDSFSCFVPCDVTSYLPFRHMQRITVRNGLSIVWEGAIINITYVATKGQQGVEIEAVGFWQYAFTLYKYHRWIDRRFQSDIVGVWEVNTAEQGFLKGDINQDQQILITPKEVQWSYLDAYSIYYSTNAGSNVKRIKFDYDVGVTAESNPVRVKEYTGAAYSANLTNVCDGQNLTSTTFGALITTSYLYIGVDNADGVTGFRFDMGGTVNANVSTMTLQYYGVDAAWHNIAITDGTASGGKTLAQDGTVTFTAIDGCDVVAVNGSQKFYYFRASFSANLTANIVINDIYVVRAQSWQMMLWDATNAATLWSTTSAGTGTQDITLAPSSASLAFIMRSTASQTPTGKGVYLKVTNLSCVAESWDGYANSTVETMMKNAVHYLYSFGTFADNYIYIGSNTYDLIDIGYVADDFQKSLADQMIDIGTFSASNTAYSVGCLPSDALPSNTKAVIYYEAYPALTDYDYVVRLDELELSGVELVTSANFKDLYNNVYVIHTDSGGKTQWAYAADDPLLTDTTSVNKYWGRIKIVQGGTSSTLAGAGVFGRPYVAAHKDLQYYMRSPLVVTGTIRKKDGTSIPVSQVRAGKRIKIENWGVDVGDVAGAGLTFLISATEYNDDANSVSITAGVPDDLAIYLNRNAALDSQRI